jgi:hypothetical protein
MGNNPDKRWHWGWLSANPNITWEIVRDNPDKSWSWISLSRNPNITLEILRDNPEESWDWEYLSLNKIIYDPIINNKEIRKDIKYRTIQYRFIFEKISFFSRNIDRLIQKRINYV